MRILLVTPRYTPHIGGVEYVVKSIAERLAKIGHDVTVLAGEPGTGQTKKELINKVKVIRWPTQVFREAYHIPRMRNKLTSLVKELVREVDVIHIHNAHAVFPIYVGIKAKDLHPDIRLVFTPHYHAHGHTLIRELAWRILWRKYVKKLIRYSNKVHAVSIVDAKRIANHYPIAKEKIVIIPNGVEEDVFEYKWNGQNSDYMMYAGRIEKYKNLELAVDLVQILGLKMVILGKGSYKRSLQRYARRYAPQKVEFRPPQPRQTYLKLLAGARYAVNLSTRESFSIFIAEALALGTPCIVSKTIVNTLNLKHVQKLLGRLFFVIPKSDIKISTWTDVSKRILTELYL